MRLGVGQCTPLFAIGEDRLSWYQRLPGAGTGGWAGILRGEVARSTGVADPGSRPGGRGAAPLRGPRPPRPARAAEPHPRRGPEWRLRHRMRPAPGAPAVRRASAGARLDALPVAAVGVAEPEHPAVAA